jgi:hypothetical protein
MINSDHDSNQFPTSLFYRGNNIDSGDQFVPFCFFSTPFAAGFRESRFLIKFCSRLFGRPWKNDNYKAIMNGLGDKKLVYFRKGYRHKHERK